MTVNLGEGPARAAQFLAEHGLSLPVLLDRDWADGEPAAALRRLLAAAAAPGKTP